MNSGRASIARASSISVSGGSAVRSTSARGAIASRRAPTSCGLQSPTTRSTAPAAMASSGLGERVDRPPTTRVEIPGSQPSSIASLETGRVGAQEGGAGAHESVEHVGARAGAPHADAPTRHAARRGAPSPRADRRPRRPPARRRGRSRPAGARPRARARPPRRRARRPRRPARACAASGVPVTVRQNVTLMRPPRPAARGRRRGRAPARRPGPGPGAARPGRGSRRRSGTRGRS